MEIKMKTDCDCMVACFAMLMNWNYEQAAEYFPPKAVSKTGYRFEWLTEYLKANGIYLTWFDNENIKPDWTRPALVDVPSLTAPDKSDHIIFWNGERVIDPTNKEIRYTELPIKINAVYQINERWTK